MLIYAASASAGADVVWRLLAEPRQWHRWAPHVRGGRGLGDPEVEPGSVGRVQLWPGLPVPARITAKQPGRRWDWRVGPLEMGHAAIPHERGCEITLEVSGGAASEGLIAVTYGPLIKLLLQNLTRVAERDG